MSSPFPQVVSVSVCAMVVVVVVVAVSRIMGISVGRFMFVDYTLLGARC